MVDVDTIYFDEAHNSVQQKTFFHLLLQHFSQQKQKGVIFFTATPKAFSRSLLVKAGMN